MGILCSAIVRAELKESKFSFLPADQQPFQAHCIPFVLLCSEERLLKAQAAPSGDRLCLFCQQGSFTFPSMKSSTCWR